MKDKQFRNEIKCILTYGQYISLKNMFYHILKPDKYSINGSYHVRSLYFDDYAGSAMQENESGIRIRKKYRIRIYNRSDQVIRLEKKSKVNSLVNKQYERISKEIFYKLIKNEDIAPTGQSGILNELLGERKSKLLSPSAIVEYDREAFVLPASNVRLTFDKNLCYGMGYDIFNEKLISKSIFPNNEVIFEIKYDKFLPDYIKNILRYYNCSITAASKYRLSKKTQERLILNVLSAK